MSLEFEWDGRKDTQNRRKHGVSFEEAATAFADPRSITVPDPQHSFEEDRFVLPGFLSQQALGCRSHGERRQSPHHQRSQGNEE